MLFTFALTSSALFAFSSLLLCASVISILRKSSRPMQGFPELEIRRREELKASHALYQHTWAVVDELAPLVRSALGQRNANSLQKDLRFSSERPPWLPEEFLSIKLVEGFCISIPVAGMACIFSFVAGVMLMLVFSIGWMFVSLLRVGDEAQLNRKRLKARFPFAIDLMALVIGAGATFLDSLKTVVRENEDSPLGDKLRDVVDQIELGRPRRLALEDFRKEMDDPDILEVVFAINTAEELGTPLSSILQTQADQMRLKKSQWGEKAAAEAQVKMVYPGMLVALACMLVILAPFLVPLVFVAQESLSGAP